MTLLARSKQRTPLSVAVLALASACATSRGEPGSKIEAVENGLRPWVLVEGDATWSIADRMREHHVPGVSIAVFRDGKILWAKGYGIADVELQQPVTPQTLFQAGSISKPVAAAGALALVERGQLALGADINTVLKSWQVPSNEHTARAPVTLDGLLSHTAGLTVHGFPGYEAGTPVPSVVQVLDGTPPANTAAVRVDIDPGTRWRYSGGGYTVAQLAMTDVTGKPFDDLMSELVLQPFGMTRSTYEQPLPGARIGEAAAGYRSDGSVVPGKRNVYPEAAAAGLWTTASDIARFAIGLQGILLGEHGPLKQASVEGMLRVRMADYALGLGIEGPYFTHSGADQGFRSFMYAHKTKGYGIAMMTNSDSGQELMLEILRSVGAAYAWEDLEAVPVKVAKLAPEELAKFAGRYGLDQGSALTLTVHGAGLEGWPTLRPPFELIPDSASSFVRRDEDVQYVFGPQGLRAVRYLDSTVLPKMNDDQRLLDEELAAGHLDAALAGYRRLRKANSEDPLVEQERLDAHGSALLERTEFSAALAVLRLNTEFQPDSSRALDRFAEGTEKSGDKPGAILLYRRALELASRPNSVHTTDDRAVRSHASERLKALGDG